jgi:hypothetical protein
VEVPNRSCHRDLYDIARPCFISNIVFRSEPRPNLFHFAGGTLELRPVTLYVIQFCRYHQSSELRPRSKSFTGCISPGRGSDRTYCLFFQLVAALHRERQGHGFMPGWHPRKHGQQHVTSQQTWRRLYSAITKHDAAASGSGYLGADER